MNASCKGANVIEGENRQEVADLEGIVGVYGPVADGSASDVSRDKWYA